MNNGGRSDLQRGYLPAGNNTYYSNVCWIVHGDDLKTRISLI